MASRYCLRVVERLDPAWAAWLGNPDVINNADGTTTLTGDFTDQAMLLQLVQKMHDLGMTILTLQSVGQDTNH